MGVRTGRASSDCDLDPIRRDRFRGKEFFITTIGRPLSACRGEW